MTQQRFHFFFLIWVKFAANSLAVGLIPHAELACVMDGNCFQLANYRAIAYVTHSSQLLHTFECRLRYNAAPSGMPVPLCVYLVASKRSTLFGQVFDPCQARIGHVLSGLAASI